MAPHWSSGWAICQPHGELELEQARRRRRKSDKLENFRKLQISDLVMVPCHHNDKITVTTPKMASMAGSEQVQQQQQHGSDAGESTALLSKRGAGGGGGTARLLVHSNGSNSSDPFRDSKSGHGGSLSTSG